MTIKQHEKDKEELRELGVKELDPGFKNDWHSTLEALKDSNKAKDEIIAALIADNAELESSLRHMKIAQLLAYEDYSKKLNALRAAKERRFWWWFFRE